MGLTDESVYKNSIPCKKATVELALHEPQTRNHAEMAQNSTDTSKYKKTEVETTKQIKEKHEKTARNHPKMRQMLTKASGNVDLQNKRGDATLCEVNEHNDTKTAQMLINAGASIDLQNKYGDTALYEVKRRNDTKTAHMLTDAIEYKNYAPNEKASQTAKQKKINERKKKKRKLNLLQRIFCCSKN